MTESEALAKIAAKVQEAGSTAAWARLHDLSPSYVRDVLRGLRPPSKRVLEPCGMIRTTTYSMKEE